ncbi:MAG: YcbK family protein [Deltaproteobacteria bacterium]|nr:YcbK family protein [Deltaproteobacteria bacterium]
MMNKNIRLALSLFAGIVAGILFPGSEGQTTLTHPSLFRYTGDGVLPIYDVHSKEHRDIIYRDADGKYSDDALAEIDRLLASPSDGEQLPISLKLIELVDHLQDHFKSPVVQILSGYRSPEHNAALKKRNRRVAHRSMHMRGRAVDMKLPGVDSRQVRNYALSLRSGGVGYYGRNRFFHIDTGPIRKW